MGWDYSCLKPNTVLRSRERGEGIHLGGRSCCVRCAFRVSGSKLCFGTRICRCCVSSLIVLDVLGLSTGPGKGSKSERRRVMLAADTLQMRRVWLLVRVRSHR